MTAVLKIADYTNKNAIAVPLNSIQRTDEGDFAFIDSNGYARKKNIKTGASYGGKTEVLSGLTAGEKLITEGSGEVEDGDKLKVL